MISAQDNGNCYKKVFLWFWVMVLVRVDALQVGMFVGVEVTGRCMEGFEREYRHRMLRKGLEILDRTRNHMWQNDYTYQDH